MTPRGWLWGAGAFGLLAVACVGGQSGTEGSEAPGNTCNYVAVRVVGPDETTDNGTVDALAAEVEQAASVPMHILAQQDGGSDIHTTLALVASVDRASGEVVRRPDYDAADPCGTLLTVRAVLHFDAADGSFKDVFDGTIQKGGGQTSFSATLPLERHSGTLDLTALAKKNYANPVLNVATTLGSLPSGRLTLEGNALQSDPSTASTSTSIAEWP